MLGEGSSGGEDAGGEAGIGGEHAEKADVLVKLIRLIAHLAISPAIGESIAVADPAGFQKGLDEPACQLGRVALPVLPTMASRHKVPLCEMVRGISMQLHRHEISIDPFIGMAGIDAIGNDLGARSQIDVVQGVGHGGE